MAFGGAAGRAAGWLLLCWLSALATVGRAAEWQAVQGGIVALSHPAVVAGVRVFGRSWPVHARAGGTVAWVGVDLARKPGDYPVRWSDGSTERLRVRQGRFSTSFIEVPRSMAEFDAKKLARIRHDQALLRAAARRPVARSFSFRFAFRPVEGVVSTPFGARRFVNGRPRAPHSGIDIAAPRGTPVRLPADGVVLLAAPMYLSGNTVVVGHGEGVVEIFAHLERVAVHAGERLHRGASVGTVGATGRATGPHLHWGVRFRGARVTPDALLPR